MTMLLAVTEQENSPWMQSNQVYNFPPKFLDKIDQSSKVKNHVKIHQWNCFLSKFFAVIVKVMLASLETLMLWHSESDPETVTNSTGRNWQSHTSGELTYCQDTDTLLGRWESVSHLSSRALSSWTRSPRTGSWPGRCSSHSAPSSRWSAASPRSWSCWQHPHCVHQEDWGMKCSIKQIDRKWQILPIKH